jgi:hypothetical protein
MAHCKNNTRNRVPTLKTVVMEGVLQLNGPNDTVNFTRNIQHLQQVVVHRVHVEGVPTIAGIPETHFFTLTLDGFHKTDLHSNIPSAQSGLLIPITGVDNYLDFNQPHILFKQANETQQRNTNANVKKSDATPATFNRLTLFYTVEEEHRVTDSYLFDPHSTFTKTQKVADL